jgi:hypothetical protein
VKRFIDTEMMLRPWFRNLTPRLKCLWLWMLTRCDMAGVLDMDWGLASFAIGEECTEADLAAMNGNVEFLGGSKVWIPGFIRFQYGELSDASKVHQGVLRVMASHGIEYHKGMERVFGVENTPKDKDNDKDKTTDIQGDARGDAKPDPIKADFEAAWKAYPDKSGKTAAEKAYRKYRKEGDTQADILAGIARYMRYVAAQRQGGFDLKWRNGQTFFNGAGWRDEYATQSLPPVTQPAPKPKQDFGPTFQ